MLTVKIQVKRFIHDPVGLVDGACGALLSLHPGLAFDVENRGILRIIFNPVSQLLTYLVIYRPLKASEKRVTLLSGG